MSVQACFNVVIADVTCTYDNLLFLFHGTITIFEIIFLETRFGITTNFFQNQNQHSNDFNYF